MKKILVLMLVMLLICGTSCAAEGTGEPQTGPDPAEPEEILVEAEMAFRYGDVESLIQDAEMVILGEVEEITACYDPYCTVLSTMQVYVWGLFKWEDPLPEVIRVRSEGGVIPKKELIEGNRDQYLREHSEKEYGKLLADAGDALVRCVVRGYPEVAEGKMYLFFLTDWDGDGIWSILGCAPNGLFECGPDGSHYVRESNYWGDRIVISQEEMEELCATLEDRSGELKEKYAPSA